MFRVKTMAAGLTRPLKPRIYHVISTRVCSSKAGSGNDLKSRQMSTATAKAAAAEPFLSGTSSNYADAMYAAWKKDPNSVHQVW